MIFIVLIVSLGVFASDLDDQLNRYIDQFRYAPVKRLKNSEPAKYRLGKKLFFDKRLSLTNEISCSTCHDPQYASSDSLPFSIGTGGEGLGIKRKQGHASITRRSSPSLYNKGHSDFNKMFWDGRVFYSDSGGGRFYTPEPGLNGMNPKFTDLTKVLDSALAAQALFPMTDGIEMRGSSTLSNREVWATVSTKIKNLPEYRELLELSFKTSADKINIAHIANALAYYQSRFFQATNTNWDKYLRGNKQAMSDSEKRGAIIFTTKAKCARCHHGKFLTNFAFQNVGIPQIESSDHSGADLGRSDISKQNYDKFSFATQPLRNISKTAPYFHNGAYQTLEDVIDHYANTQDSIYFYDIKNLNNYFRFNFSQRFWTLKDPEVLKIVEQYLNPQVRRGFSLSSQEREDLLLFLKLSLTEN